jgi:hypothetical protein
VLIFDISREGVLPAKNTIVEGSSRISFSATGTAAPLNSLLTLAGNLKPVTGETSHISVQLKKQVFSNISTKEFLYSSVLNAPDPWSLGHKIAVKSGNSSIRNVLL